MENKNNDETQEIEMTNEDHYSNDEKNGEN